MIQGGTDAIFVTSSNRRRPRITSLEIYAITSYQPQFLPCDQVMGHDGYIFTDKYNHGHCQIAKYRLLVVFHPNFPPREGGALSS